MPYIYQKYMIRVQVSARFKLSIQVLITCTALYILHSAYNFYCQQEIQHLFLNMINISNFKNKFTNKFSKLIYSIIIYWNGYRFRRERSITIFKLI